MSLQVQKRCFYGNTYAYNCGNINYSHGLAEKKHSSCSIAYNHVAFSHSLESSLCCVCIFACHAHNDLAGLCGVDETTIPSCRGAPDAVGSLAIKDRHVDLVALMDSWLTGHLSSGLLMNSRAAGQATCNCQHIMTPGRWLLWQRPGNSKQMSLTSWQSGSHANLISSHPMLSQESSDNMGNIGEQDGTDHIWTTIGQSSL